MTSRELRQKFLAFFEQYGHKIIPSASLVPENDPSVLFTTAGMHPLVPYLLGEKHPLGNRLCDIQRCLRMDDIEEVGDAQHLTFFEMLGYWSLGDYFKKESIHYTFDFYTEVLGFKKDGMSVSVFAGDADAKFDQESFDTWKNEIGIPEERIYKYPKKENWWGPVGDAGPCGPCTEIFIDTGLEKCSSNCGPSCDCDKFVEIGNNVFMEFEKTIDGKFQPLKQKNVDVGLGFERLLMFSQAKEDVFETDLFEPIIKRIEELSGKKYAGNHKAFRIIADHIRASVFLSADGVAPSNVGQGYILRRLIRRAIRYSWMLDVEASLKPVMEEIINQYQDIFHGLTEDVLTPLLEEQEKFKNTIQEGLKQAARVFSQKKSIDHKEYAKIMQLDNRDAILHRIHSSEPNDEIDLELKKLNINITNNDMHAAYVSGQEAFNLFQSFGFPLELITELAQKENLFVGITAFNEEMKAHQEKSRTASAGMFKGGLTSQSDQATKYHTATHLLLASLRKVLGLDVHQKGANINDERIRFDFSYPEKLTLEQIKEVEDLVNDKIAKDLEVSMEEMSLEDAQACGAVGDFAHKYADKVKVYSIADFSKEICGGPHVKTTGNLGHFKITKEESSSAGVRRIKAILE